MHFLQSSFLIGIGLSKLAAATEFQCLPGYPSMTGRYEGPPGWGKDGDPLPKGWNWGDVLSTKVLKVPHKRNDINATTDASTPNYPMIFVNPDDYTTPGLNMTEMDFTLNIPGSQEALDDDIGDGSGLEKRGRPGQHPNMCCRWTWDCHNWHKYGPWKLGYNAEGTDEFKKSWCCVRDYRASCNWPAATWEDFKWPPACNNPRGH